MTPLTLLMCALIGTVLVEAVRRSRVGPHRRWFRSRLSRDAGARRAAAVGGVEPTAGIGGWENEGGSMAVSGPIDAPVAPARAGQAAAHHGRIIEPKAA